MIEVIPGILEKDYGEIARKVGLVAPLTEWVQLDFADETLVPNTTFKDFERLTALTKQYDKLSFEAHLMVASPEKYIRLLVDAGFKRLIAHVEASDPRLFLEQARYESAEVGLALDGPTEIEQIEPYLEEIDVALIMTVEAGFSDAPFLPETVEKIRNVRRNFPDLPIAVDGGINGQTAKVVKDAGATRLVSTTYIFKAAASVAEAISSLKKA